MKTEQKGHYFGRYKILASEYLGPDFSRRCFVFSGQGGAWPGMGKEQYQAWPSIREKFNQADQLAKKLKLPKISDYILRPDNLKKETLPIIRNLALFTLETALGELLIAKKIIPQAITGHSFGEYAALVVAGVISFEDAFDIIYHRDFFCPKSNALGWMVAVNADEPTTKKALGKIKFYISNLNSSQQTVVSVGPEALEQIKGRLAEQGIKHKVLANVPQPYHSPLLEGVKDRIEKYLKNKRISFAKPRFPIFSSVSQRWINEVNFKEDEVRRILINQIITPVNFINQISSIHKERCFNFIEFGATGIWAGFVKDILVGREIKTDSASNILSTKQSESVKVISPQNNRFFSLISKTIGQVTGYEIDKISFEDRYQEDLGIDSIKKAEILLTVLDESKIKPGDNFNTSKFGSIKDTAAYLARAEQDKSGKKKLAQPPRKTNFRRYIFEPVEAPLLGSRQMIAPKNTFFSFYLVDILQGQKVCLDKINSFLDANKNRPNIVMRADSVELNPDKIILVFKFFRELLNKVKTNNFNLILVSFGQTAKPDVKCLASFFKSLKKEQPAIFFKHVHFEETVKESVLFNVLAREAKEEYETDILYKNGRRFVYRPRSVRIGSRSALTDKSVVLAIGGAKGITFSLIKDLAKRYKPAIYLVGKSPAGDKVVQANVAELKKITNRIFYRSADASDQPALDKVFSEIVGKYKKIDLVLNGAGAVRIGFLRDKTDKDIDFEFNNKVWPAVNVLKLAKKYKPKKIINFSSIISRYGSAGQTIYTAANALLEGLTQEDKSLKAAVVHWPPWDGVGMTDEPGVWQKLKESGVALLKPDEANKLFRSELSLSGLKPSVYYLDDNDDELYSFSLNNLEQLKPLIGELSDPFSLSATKSVFKKTFDLASDHYLADHKIKNLSYVPAAVGLGMFLCLGRAYFRSWPVLENIALRNPVVVGEPGKECLLESARKNGRHTFSIKSSLTYFYGEATGKLAGRAPKIVLPRAEQEIIRSSIYSDYYFKDSLYLGPIFQSIDQTFLDKKDNPFLAVDNNKLLPVLGLYFYDKLIQWLDVLFQALGAVALKQNLKMIPVAVDKLVFFPETAITKRVYALPAKVRLAGLSFKGDAVLANESGEVIIRLDGAYLRKIDEYPKSRLEFKKLTG